MSRKEDLLREACALAAQEETERLKKRMGVQNVREADALYKRHRRAVLGLIARKTRGGRGRTYLRAAACLLLVAGGVWLALFQQRPDYTPLAPGPSATVRPFDSSVPIFETPSPVITVAPTSVQVSSPFPSVFPTDTAFSEEIEAILPTMSPTLAPTPTPTPVPTPSPEPVELPAAAVNAAPDEGITPPAAWQGQHFPQWLPEGGLPEIVLAESAEDACTVRITIPGDGNAPAQSMEFTEYAASLPLSLDAAEAESGQYIQLGQRVALRVISAQGSVRLLWDQDGRTLALSSATATEAEMEKIAASVEKIILE